MKKRIRIIFGIAAACFLLVILCITADAASWTTRQIKAHEIATLARNIGLPEDDPIIVRAKEIWHEDEALYMESMKEFSEQDVAILARVIYWEAGNGCTEEHMLLVGRVVLNRVNDERFPDTIYDVVMQPRQYLPGYANGNSRYAVPEDRVEELEGLARRVLAGEPEGVPGNVIYQDNLRHGTGVYKSFYSELLRSTTYFCYG